MPDVANIVLALVGVALLGLWYVLKARLLDRKAAEARTRIEAEQRNARKEAEGLKKERLLEAKDQIFNWRSDTEKELQGRRQEVQVMERRLSRKEDDLEEKERGLRRGAQEQGQQLQQFQQREQKLSEAETKIEELAKKVSRQLETVAGMSSQEAKQALLRSVEQEALKESAHLARRIEGQAREKAEQEARKIITQAIQRCAGEHVVSTTVSVVDLPSDDMKGRIIGREGRNIRALEQATGVELIVDDTPEAVILSAFDPFRREIAKMAIERLIHDGRIHPARIEEVVRQVQKEMDKRLHEEGEQAAFEFAIHDFPDDILRYLGRLRFRTSYGQNVLSHSREVAYLAGIMAREVGADVEVCKRAGLMHDIGKAVDRDMEGTHLQLGVELARKHRQSEEVIHAIEAHHFDVEFRTLEAVLVQAADATSAARPGARREMLESYIKRLETLEAIASSFSGVAKAFALQAGREIRIIVESSEVSDEQAFWLTKDIAKKIENEMQYPGQVKVTLIREMRVVDYAK